MEDIVDYITQNGRIRSSLCSDKQNEIVFVTEQTINGCHPLVSIKLNISYLLAHQPLTNTDATMVKYKR
jgi:hypothetical protein